MGAKTEIMPSSPCTLSSLRHQALAAGVIAAGTLLSASARAQDIGDGESGGESSAPPGVTATDSQGNTVQVTGSITPPSTQTTSTFTPYGLPSPGFDPDAHLPSSSRTVNDINTPGDDFDLVQGPGAVPTVRGGSGAPAVLGQKKKKSGGIPEIVKVERGDTLWDLCATHYNNPWVWPKVWSYNPQIQNPHWIYPGDQVRLRIGGGPSQPRSTINLGGGGRSALGGGFVDRRSLVPRETVFLRTQGYLDDPDKDVWGELVGSREEQMLLAEGNHVYMIMRPGVDLQLGQLLSVFRTIRNPEKVKGARKPPGEIVAFKGTVKIDQWDPKDRVARGRITESLDVIERGAKVGPVGRRFEVIPPRRNETDVWARVLTSMYPHEFVGQNQVVFIDKGSKDGLVPGNRLFVVRRGDSWRKTLSTASKTARARVRTDVHDRVSVDYTPLEGDPEDFPEEVVGELRVLETRELSSLTLVTSSTREIEPGDRAVARKGY